MVIVLIAIYAVQVSCNHFTPDGGKNSPREAADLAFDNKLSATAAITGDVRAEITSYQAEVRRFYKNSRDGRGFLPLDHYTLFVKESNGTVMTRVDCAPSGPGRGRPLSVLHNGGEMTVFYRDNLERVTTQNAPAVSAEMAISAPEPSLTARVSESTAANIPGRQGNGRRLLPGRIDVVRMREELLKNSFDVTEEPQNHRIIAVAPPALLSNPNSAGQKILSMRILIDTRNKTLAGTEITTLDSQNNTITTIQAPMYQNVNGEPVMIGTVTEIRHHFDRRLDVSDRRLPTVTDTSKLPRTNEQELKRRIAAGARAYYFDSLVGDPSDPDYTDTWVERFDSLTLNGVDDARFSVSR